MVVLVDAKTVDCLECDNADRIMSKILSYYTGRHVIVLAPSTDGVLESYVDYIDGDGCYAGIKYISSHGIFKVEFFSGSIEPDVYDFENYYEAVAKAQELVG